MRSLLRSDLVGRLDRYRDNDVFVRVPLETGGSLRLEIADVRYHPMSDSIVIETRTHLDGPEPEEARDAG